jgi:hypothetical protein
MVTGKDQQSFYAPEPEVREDLSDGVSGTLKPVGAVASLLGSEYLDEAGREIGKAIRLRDVTIE